jgi:hypothetical protein
MKQRTIFIGILLFILVNIVYSQPNRVLIVTGGKTVDKENFYKLFENYSFDTTSKPFAFQLFDLEKINNYKVIVFYDTYQPITNDQKKSFLNIFEEGIGVLFLHHSLVSHQEWDEYEKIVGGKYFHQAWVDSGNKYGPSTYKHDQDFVVNVLNKEHPVTRELDSFQIHDENYLNYRVQKNVMPLLTTDYRESGEILGWAHYYMNSKVVYIMMGHDKNAFKNSSFKKLVENSINYLAEPTK